MKELQERCQSEGNVLQLAATDFFTESSLNYTVTALCFGKACIEFDKISESIQSRLSINFYLTESFLTPITIVFSISS